MDAYDFDVCRICVVTSRAAKLYSIKTNHDLKSKFQDLLDIQLSSDKDKKVLLCGTCKEKLEKFYKFKAEAQLTAQKYSNHLEELQSQSLSAGWMTGSPPNVDVPGKSDRKQDCMIIKGSFKLFTCDECGKKLSSSGCLRLHTNSVHRQIKPFICTICDKRFSVTGNAHYHANKYHFKDVVDEEDFRKVSKQSRSVIKRIIEP